MGYTVPCTIDNLVAFGLDLLPLLSEAAMLWGHMWEGGGIPFLAAGDLPKPASSSSEQHSHKSPCVNRAIFEQDTQCTYAVTLRCVHEITVSVKSNISVCARVGDCVCVRARV